jgi:predicted ribosome quality control (RQC) complex YloA/Tae2 family protein
VIGHYLTLEHVARELGTILRNGRLVNAWSQRKYVATLIFEIGVEQIPVVIDVGPRDASISLRKAAHRAMRNSIDVFPDLRGQRLGAVVKLEGDRVISFVFEHDVLHVELFSAGNGNVILCRNEFVTDALRARSTRIGLPFRVAADHATEPLTRLDMSLAQDLSTCSLHLGKHYASEVCLRAGLSEATRVGELSPEQRQHVQSCANDLIRTCREQPEVVSLTARGDVLLSMIPLQRWDTLQRHTSVLEAIQHVLARRRALRDLAEERQRRLRLIDQISGKLQRALQALRSDEEATSRPERYRSWADTLMAHVDVHLSGIDHIDAVNVQTSAMERIPLRPEMSILENATALYTKARNAELAARQRERRMPELQERLLTLARQREAVQSASSIDELPPRTDAMETHQRSASSAPKFREFILDETHTLYVGRNAANNDELTMKFARQQDWWLHVRGASGSHAVLRGVRGDKIPKSILEAAAAIAAYYSQARNASYVPVVYTQRKYVRKPKGANVGAVTLEREQTIMVRPSLPAGTISDE